MSDKEFKYNFQDTSGNSLEYHYLPPGQNPTATPVGIMKLTVAGEMTDKAQESVNQCKELAKILKMEFSDKIEPGKYTLIIKNNAAQEAPHHTILLMARMIEKNHEMGTGIIGKDEKGETLYKTMQSAMIREGLIAIDYDAPNMAPVILSKQIEQDQAKAQAPPLAHSPEDKLNQAATIVSARHTGVDFLQADHGKHHSHGHHHSHKPHKSDNKQVKKHEFHQFKDAVMGVTLKVKSLFAIQHDPHSLEYKMAHMQDHADKLRLHTNKNNKKETFER